jgi:ADP-ribosylglycohydrolase
MRVSSIAYLFDNEEDILREAERSAVVTHNHPEGIKGAQAMALAIFMARKGKSKAEIKDAITLKFDYDLERTLDKIRPVYSFDVSCQGSVPETIIAFLESTDFEDAIRNAISIGGDSDTIASMSGAIAEAFYKHIPADIAEEALKKLPKHFLAILKKFEENCLP